MESTISKLSFTTYSALINNIDLFKEKSVKSEYSFLNVSKLAENFPLDITLDSENIPGYTNKPPGPPAFISKSYYQSTPEFAYNYPPKGPIETYFQCVFCEKTGPNYHTVTCKRPFESSLILTQEGESKFNYTEGTSYKLVVKKRGQRKVVSGSIKSEIFADNLEILFENQNKALTTIRIAKNGSINIISNNWNNVDLPEKIIAKINKSNALNVSEYQKIYPGLTKLEIDPAISYSYLISAQFNLYPENEKDQKFINLELLNNNLWNSTSLFKKTIKGDTVFMISQDNYYSVNGYRYNSGNITSKSNKQTNPFIQFTLNINFFKINVMIYKRGSVQIRASYIKSKNIDRKVNVLGKTILTKVYTFLKELFDGIIEYSNSLGYSIIVSVLDKPKKGIPNLYDSKQPQKCQDRGTRKVRPVPYSFYGKCPIPGYYIPPRGTQRDDRVLNKDGTLGDYKREPCCTILTETGLDKAGKPLEKVLSTGKSPDTLKRYQKILKNGYPDGEFDETVPEPDNLSAVFIPGTKILESRKFKGLNSFSEDFLINCINEAGYIGEPTIFSEKKDDFTTFKNEIFKKYSVLTGTTDLIIQGASSLTNFKNFTKHAYIITPIFKDTLNVLLFFDNLGKSYFINLNKDVSETGIPIIKELANTLVEGYLYPFTSPDYIFYPVDIIYFKNVNISQTNYFIPGKRNGRFDNLMYTVSKISSIPNLELSIETLFDLDIVNYSKNFLMDPDTIGLLYIPFDSGYQIKKTNKNLMLWTDTKKEILIALNVNDGLKLSIDGKSIPEDLLPQKKLSLPKKFKINNGDLVLFKINFNITDYTINGDKPLVPLEIINYKINDYSDVINILESIKTPISRNILKVIENSRFPDTVGFTYKSKYYMLIDPNQPLEEN